MKVRCHLKFIHLRNQPEMISSHPPDPTLVTENIFLMSPSSNATITNQLSAELWGANKIQTTFNKRTDEI